MLFGGRDLTCLLQASPACTPCLLPRLPLLALPRFCACHPPHPCPSCPLPLPLPRQWWCSLMQVLFPFRWWWLLYVLLPLPPTPCPLAPACLLTPCLPPLTCPLPTCLALPHTPAPCYHHLTCHLQTPLAFTALPTQPLLMPYPSSPPPCLYHPAVRGLGSD